MTCWEKIKHSHLHESPNPMGPLGVVLTTGVFLKEVNGQSGRTFLSQWPCVRDKASHIVIVDFGCGQYKQPGEGWAPSG